MLKIEAGTFIDVNTVQGYDAMGQPELKIMIEGNYDLTTMQTNVFELQNQMQEFLEQQKEEARLRAENPALKDVHDKYKIVYELVKKADSATGNDGG